MYDKVFLERHYSTDIRWIKFDKNRIKLRFVYDENEKVSDLVGKYDADYGFNFPYFYQGNILGDSKDGDKIVSQAYGKMLKWHKFASNGSQLDIDMLDINDDFDMLVSSAPLLVEDGNNVTNYYINYQEVNSDIANSRAQRTAVGITETGDLIVAVSDGRTSYNQGLTLNELADFMISKGAIKAMNGDGGSSSSLANQNGNIGQNDGIVHHAVLVYVAPMPTIEGTARVVVNGKEVSTAYISSDNVSYLPVRDVAENLGANVRWDGSTRTIYIDN